MYPLSLRRAPLLLARWGTLMARSGLTSSLAAPSTPSLPRRLPQSTLAHPRSIHCYRFALRKGEEGTTQPPRHPVFNNMAFIRTKTLMQQTVYKSCLAALRGGRSSSFEAKLKPTEGLVEETTTFYCVSLEKPLKVQTKSDPRTYLWSCPKELQRSEAGEYVRVRRLPQVLFYMFDKSEIITASNLKSRSKVLSAYNLDTIRTVPLDEIKSKSPTVDLDLTLRLSMIDTKIIDAIKGNSTEYYKLIQEVKDTMLQETPQILNRSLAEQMINGFKLYEAKLMYEMKAAMRRVTPLEVDKLTINRSLVEQLALSRLATISGLTIDYQGSRIDSKLRVTNISARPDIVLFKRFDPSEKILTAAVAEVCTPHFESDKEGEEDEEDEEDDYNTLYGGVGELKKKTKKWDKFQLLANMVKVCGDMAVLSVRDYGKLFDCIIVYGLLIDCHTEKADLLQVKMDFINNESTVLQADTPVNYSDGFSIIGSLVSRANNV